MGLATFGHVIEITEIVDIFPLLLHPYHHSFGRVLQSYARPRKAPFPAQPPYVVFFI
jgi:hypothetical protein